MGIRKLLGLHEHDWLYFFQSEYGSYRYCMTCGRLEKRLIAQAGTVLVYYQVSCVGKDVEDEGP